MIGSKLENPLMSYLLLCRQSLKGLFPTNVSVSVKKLN